MRAKNNPEKPDVPELPVDPNAEENARFCGSEVWRHYREDPEKPGRCYYFGTPKVSGQLKNNFNCLIEPMIELQIVFLKNRPQKNSNIREFATCM